jgi:hypothetical protein
MSKPKKTTSISPEEIRRLVSEITAIPLREVVQLAPPELSRAAGHNTYIIGHDDGILICVHASDGWNISLSRESQTVAKNWSTQKMGAPRADHLKFIQDVLELNSLPAFRIYAEENDQEIIRRTFDTEIGPVRMSSRRSGQGQTEIVFEIFSTNKVFRLLQDRATGKLDFNAPEFMDASPF